MDELNIKNKCINCNIDFDINKDLISLNYSKKTKREILKKLLNIKKNSINKENIINDLKFKDNNNEINLLRHKTKRNNEI